MNDAEKEAIRCLGFSLTKVCPRHSEDEECALCDGTGKIYTCEGLGVISKFTQTLQKKQDEIERLKVELNQYQTQTVNVVAFHKLEDEVQRLTARNKELEQENQHLANVSVSLNSKIEDFKKSEKALQGRTVSCEACNGMAEKVKELESKIAKAREAFERVISKCYMPGMEDPFNDFWEWFYKCQDALAELGEK